MPHIAHAFDVADAAALGLFNSIISWACVFVRYCMRSACVPLCCVWLCVCCVHTKHMLIVISSCWLRPTCVINYCCCHGCSTCCGVLLTQCWDYGYSERAAALTYNTRYCYLSDARLPFWVGSSLAIEWHNETMTIINHNARWEFVCPFLVWLIKSSHSKKNTLHNSAHCPTWVNDSRAPVNTTLWRNKYTLIQYAKAFPFRANARAHIINVMQWQCSFFFTAARVCL